ncbi:uncharacterized protein DUF4326 [Actinoplanes teichomyceticus]|uniref:Uncharacterized protein DUF4326 n=2 Tax=Actinoplanes teichomyceticus TaxID=1867 RepID=A0A561WBY8_ACTTI|nr:uncharacterized protein DUF4326 [Actinoplanes teichomyceticus]
MARQARWRDEHPDAARVDRFTRWGHPFPADEHGGRRRGVPAGAAGRRVPGVAGHPPVTVDAVRTGLAGRDLACWCRPDEPCHAQVLLEVAVGEALLLEGAGRADGRRAAVPKLIAA